MAKYIKQEMTDLHGNGENKVFYRMKTNRNYNLKKFAEYICHRGTVIDRGLVENVILRIVDGMAELLADGNSVTIEGLGTFKAGLGLKPNKEMDDFDENKPKLNARSLQLTDIHYRADRNLIKAANRLCKLERAGESHLRQSPYSKEERLKLALEFLGKNGAMQVMDYVELTGLSRTKATLELKEFREDKDSGITFTGRGSHKVYVKSVAAVQGDDRTAITETR